jgi:hypothetical protein
MNRSFCTYLWLPSSSSSSPTEAGSPAAPPSPAVPANNDLEENKSNAGGVFPSSSGDDERDPDYTSSETVCGQYDEGAGRPAKTSRYTASATDASGQETSIGTEVFRALKLAAANSLTILTYGHRYTGSTLMAPAASWSGSPSASVMIP